MEMKLSEIKNLNQLRHFIDNHSVEDIIKISEEEYLINKQDETKEYEGYKKERIRALIKAGKYKMLIWIYIIKRFSPIAKFIFKLKNIEVSSDYFSEPIFWEDFKNPLNSLVCWYKADTNETPTYSEIIFDIKHNIEKLDKSPLKDLKDKDSLKCLFNILMFRITRKINYIIDIDELNELQYFDKKIITCDENEIFVDCGGYTGDTVKAYVKSFGRFKKLYFYEPEKNILNKAYSNLKKYSKFGNIDIRECGVSNEKRIVYFNVSDFAGSSISDMSENRIQVVTLDEDINEKVSFIKMDIEGEEIKALNGSRNHIINDNPKLAICLYHRLDDIWKIPTLIYDINTNYEFYFRHYGAIFGDTVMYCVPKV